MAAPSGPAGSGAVKKVTSATQEEKSSKKRAPEPKTREREHIERILEEREERHTGTSVFFRGDLTEKLRHVPKIAPLPTFSPRSPRIGPMSPAPPVSAASPDPPGPPVLSVLPGTSAAPTPMPAPRPYRQKALIAVAFLLIVAGAFLFSLTLWTAVIPAHKDDYACNTPICEQVRKQLLDYADSTINPCDDFYSHVCGHWLRKADRTTFMLDAKKQFIARRHELLVSPESSSDPNSAVLETAHAFLHVVP
ncbi:hypothetical protein MTO96_003951 [Rhipicephalus appendiculatus]